MSKQQLRVYLQTLQADYYCISRQAERLSRTNRRLAERMYREAEKFKHRITQLKNESYNYTVLQNIAHDKPFPDTWENIDLNNLKT